MSEEYFCVVDDCSYYILKIIREFLDMFEIVEERVICLDDYKDVIVVAENSCSMFYKEVESIFIIVM